MTTVGPGGWEIAGIFVSFFMLMAVYGRVFYLLNRQIRSKGFAAPFTWLCLASAYIAALLGAGYAVYRLFPLCWTCAAATSLEAEQVWRHIGVFGACCLLGSMPFAGVTVAVCRCLPQQERRGGARTAKFPWTAVSRVLLLCVFITPVAIYLWVPGGWGNWFKLSFRFVVLFFGGYRWAAYMAKRLAAPGLDQTLAADQRAPVFYLREFAQEEKPFTNLSYNECERLGVPMLNVTAFRHPATLEQYFDLSIRQRTGPFVALGNPYDYAPPVGAAREYLADEKWIDAFRSLAQRSSWIIMHAGGSANLRQELTMLRQMNLNQKLFVVTEPKPKRYVRVASEEKKWQAFSELFTESQLTPCGYPGFGAVVSFENNAAIVLTNGCKTPEDYVAAIERRLTEIVAPAPYSAALSTPAA